ncbi:MAG: helix-turn-helix domain-containing protein [Clostridia bacterium]|nr:helix-turn-helix domain-containing protein [Clostridia bacterium]NCC43787.1 helix-turn-helix domain-containing protein [Clostridia bacterium]
MTLEEMKRIKEEKGYTITQLAEYTGIPVGTLQKIFSGETRTPRYATRQALENVLQADKVKEPSTYAVNVPRYHGSYTVEDYYTMSGDKRVELIDGEIYDMCVPSVVHQGISANVFFQLRQKIKEQGGSCVPLYAPVDVRLDCDDRTMVQPDVLIICDKSKIKKWGILGAPDFILEVASDSTRKIDYYKKTTKYMEAGVKEYWIIDPIRERLTIYDFQHEEGPAVYPLAGEIGLIMYDSAIRIDLKEVGEEIQEYPDEC